MYKIYVKYKLDGEFELFHECIEYNVQCEQNSIILSWVTQEDVEKTNSRDKFNIYIIPNTCVVYIKRQNSVE